MPQISPISWTLIILTLVIFLSVTNSNIPNTNNTMDLNNNINPTNNSINW